MVAAIKIGALAVMAVYAAIVQAQRRGLPIVDAISAEVCLDPVQTLNLKEAAFRIHGDGLELIVVDARDAGVEAQVHLLATPRANVTCAATQHPRSLVASHLRNRRRRQQANEHHPPVLQARSSDSLD